MKQVIKSVLMLLGLLCVSCTGQKSQIDTEIEVLIDQTDPLVYPTAEEITAPLGLQNDPWQGVKIVISSISDKDINSASAIALDKENEWSGSKVIRKAKIQRFKKRLQQCLDAMKSSGTRPHSIIYRAIASHARRLAGSAARKRYLLIWSNLYENSEVNFYDPQTMDLLRTNPQGIERRLEATMPLSKLSGIDVWLLYNPSSYEENNAYMTIARFYQHLLEARGAAVHVDIKLSPQ